ncbi:hypothetical protein C8Q78DRAFT_640302 [Trametes maxima]|nr:hypothetical protein C8Q78DRAFT_640302 [Trametes maxima]
MWWSGLVVHVICYSALLTSWGLRPQPCSQRAGIWHLAMSGRWCLRRCGREQEHAIPVGVRTQALNPNQILRRSTEHAPRIGVARARRPFLRKDEFDQHRTEILTPLVNFEQTGVSPRSQDELGSKRGRWGSLWLMIYEVNSLKVPRARMSMDDTSGLMSLRCVGVVCGDRRPNV